MPWFVELDSSGNPTTTVEKATKSPGKNWLLVAEASDNMSQQQVEQLVKAYQKGQQPLGPSGPTLNPLSALGNWTIGGISGKNLLIRGAKIVIGAVILILGLAKMTSLDNKAIKSAIKVAPLL